MSWFFNTLRVCKKFQWLIAQYPEDYVTTRISQSLFNDQINIFLAQIHQEENGTCGNWFELISKKNVQTNKYIERNQHQIASVTSMCLLHILPFIYSAIDDVLAHI